MQSVNIGSMDEVIRNAAVAAENGATGVHRALGQYLESSGGLLELAALRAELVALAAGYESTAHDGSTRERRRSAAQAALVAWDSVVDSSGHVVCHEPTGIVASKTVVDDS